MAARKRQGSRISYWLAIGCWLLLAGWTADCVVAQDSETEAIDFETQIQPILAARCIFCHGPDLQEGHLRLDSREFAEAGGHTTNRVLGSADESELYRRIASDDEDYRMPPQGARLSVENIGLIGDWLRQGAPWPVTPPTRAAGKKVPGESLAQRIEAVRGRIQPVLYAGLVALGLILLIERRRKARPRDSESRFRDSPLSRLVARINATHYLIIVLSLVIAAMWLNQEAVVRELQSDKQRMRLAIHQQVSRPGETAANTSGAPVPIRPPHPFRLGGVYYRGNDERNQKLFNGGNYRTATIDVALFGARDHRLEWDDAIGKESLFIRCEIRRAPKATPALFQEPLGKQTFLSRQLPGTEETDAPVPFETIEPGDLWRASYPLGTSPGNGGRLAGMIYLYRGNAEEDVGIATAHYGIQYDLRIADGRVTRESEIWMGSLYNLNGKIYLPPPGKVAFPEWFDSSPIPEITGENTDDPELLGIGEPDFPPQ